MQERETNKQTEGVNMPKFNIHTAREDMGKALELVHYIKLDAQYTEELTTALGTTLMDVERNALDMLIAIKDIELTLKSLKGIFKKEHQDAVDRQNARRELNQLANK
jgi:hypothetical protein